MEPIVAISTAQGAGAVALVRLSGDNSWYIAQKLLRKPFEPQAGRVYLRALYDGEAVLDKALLTFFKAPRSFTGEDTVEFAVHGSAYIKRRLVEILINFGARAARGGEYSQRAFLNGKMDLVEAEALCDLIAADSRAAHSAAMTGFDGAVSQKFNEIKYVLSELLAQIEVRLDDVDNEMAPLSLEDMFASLDSVEQNVERLLQSYSTGRFLKEGIKVSIAGEPNAGKSSLLNALVGYNRAIVAEEAGTTRDTIEDTFDHKGNKIVITDTAGIRAHAQGYAEKEGIERSLAAIQKADAVLFVTDGSAQNNPAEDALYKEILAHEKPVVTVLNKADLGIKKKFDGVKVSAQTGAGVEAIKDKLVEAVGAHEAAGIMITSAIQYGALMKCKEELSGARVSAREGGEFMAEHIRAALRAVKETIGDVTADDILGIIFSKFCVGK